jgi:hypothetical protein
MVDYPQDRLRQRSSAILCTQRLNQLLDINIILCYRDDSSDRIPAISMPSERLSAFTRSKFGDGGDRSRRLIRSGFNRLSSEIHPIIISGF